MGRWLPPLILAVVAVSSGLVVADLQGPPTSTPSVEGPRSTTPVLSLRRNLTPLTEMASVDALRNELDAFVATQPADTCLRVRAEDLRYDHRVDDPQAPASVQKLLTAVAALSELGPDTTLETDVLTGPVAGGVVSGTLYVRGGGDPLLATAEYMARERDQPQIYSSVESLADAIVAAGVTTIVGSVVGDESRFDQVRYNPVWPSRFIAQGQIGPVSALSVNDAFDYFPETAAGGFGPAPDPGTYAAAVVDAALRARGVQIGAPPTSGPTPSGGEVLVTHRSPPVADIVVQMLRESDNNTAEILLKELGYRRSGEGTFGTGQAAVRATLEEAGIEMAGVNVADGSGLATENVVTCDVVLDLLDHEPTASAVLAGLAVAGESGTLARRWLDTDLVGRVRAKTGTLNQVTALAGIAQTAAGAPASFALIANLDAGTIDLATVAAQQQLAEALVAHPQRADVDHLRPRAP
ncbi:MAG: D-alanyl-D-alanine carboxypeptidase/D-alanyl-D-alanine endopeptidase [Acidimicrobiales bacterium]